MRARRQAEVDAHEDKGGEKFVGSVRTVFLPPFTHWLVVCLIPDAYVSHRPLPRERCSGWSVACRSRRGSLLGLRLYVASDFEKLTVLL